jgi:hypothetical protein
MKKSLLIVLLCLNALSVIFSEVVVLKNKEVLKGKIISIKEDWVTLEVNALRMEIESSQIYKIYYLEEEYERDRQMLSGTQDQTSDMKRIDQTDNLTEDKIIRKERKKIRFIDKSKQDPEYRLFKGFLGASLGTVIPGSVLMLASIYYIAMPLSNYYAIYYYDRGNFYDYQMFSYFIVGVSFLTTGFILDLISIGMFIGMNYHYRKWKQKVLGASLLIRSGPESLDLGVSFKF